MAGITLGKPHKFLKGLTKIIITDPATGDIIGYDNVPVQEAFSYSANMGEVVGGLGNQLLTQIPDTTRLSGRFSSQTFNMDMKALQFGSEVDTSGIIVLTTEKITANSTTLTVQGTPCKAMGQAIDDQYAWCYVRELGASTFAATNYNIDTTTKEVHDFTATQSKVYEVMYYTEVQNKGEFVAIKSAYIPKIVTLQLQFVLWASDGSASNSSKDGYITLIVPRAILSPNAETAGDQANVAEQSVEWSALAPSTYADLDDSCGDDAVADYAYLQYVPCDAIQ